jgi:arylsulfatase A-like enzyme
MKTKIIFLSFCALVLWSCGAKQESSSENQSPNIIFILADDLGWADVGFNGGQFYETPNLNRLAAAGIQFTNAYANAANCAPTRASILSGQYTPRHGILTVNGSDRGDEKAQRLVPIPNKSVLETTTVSLAEMLKTSRYDLEKDKAETQDLSQTQPELREQLLQSLKDWHSEAGAVVPTQQNSQFDSLYATQTYKSIQYE